MKEPFSLRTVRKKIIMMSKILGILLIVSYVVSGRLPFHRDISFLLWVLWVVLLVFAADFFLKRFISEPIYKICEAAHKIARLDFSSPCEVRSKDEFGDLAGNLNQMSENLQHTLKKLEEANNRLEQEVWQERQLLEERKELVDRLSHEMKTPLSIIRAYAEGIQDETDEGKRQRYADIIISETQRTGVLITRLLDLSALENGAVSLTPERFEFVEFVETAAGRLLIDVPGADFELHYELPEHSLYVYADKPRMEQVINNLLINAQRNVSPKGILRLVLAEQSGKLRFSVFNQGVPIPQDKLSQIWKKFYRDESAKYSGSGLGLAVVAQILSMQDFEYGVRNISDGVEFYFFVPIIQ